MRSVTLGEARCLQFASCRLLARLHGGNPSLERSVVGVVGALELDVQVGQDRKQSNSVADAALRSSEAMKLFGGSLQFAELHRTRRSDRAIAPTDRDAGRAGAQEQRPGFGTVAAFCGGRRPSAQRIVSKRLGKGRRGSRQRGHRLAGAADGQEQTTLEIAHGILVALLFG